MNLVRFENPVYRYGYANLLDRLYENSERTEKKCSPAVNISEDEKSFVVEFSVPGYKKEQFSLLTDDGILKVKAEVEENDTENSYHKQEFAVCPFERLFNVPENVDSDGISASYHDGVLGVILPKREDQETNKQVEIKVQ